jgi:S1-C subfamily serine protease
MASVKAKRFGIAAVIVAALVGFGAAMLLTRQQPASREAWARPPAGTEAPASFAPVARAVIPAVVNVDTTAYRRVTSIWDLFEGKPYSVIPEKGRASGFVVRSEGYVLTNEHVISGAEEITVTFYDGKRLSAKAVGRDPVLDLAVLKVDAKNLPATVLGDSSAIQPGDWAIAIGNPFGFHHTVTVGVISALGRPIEMEQSGRYYEDLIQTDAYINQGNSGGPLLNAKGEVVGINTMIFAAGSVPAPIGFAIPINRAKAAMEQLIAHGKVVRSWIGVRLGMAVPADDEGRLRLGLAIAARLGIPVAADVAERYAIPESHGVLVREVRGGGPADKVGLAAGSIILSIRGQAVTDAPQAARVVRQFPVGSTISVEFLRLSDQGWQRLKGDLRTVEAPAGLAPDVT